MLRCANKFPRLLYFMRADDTPWVRVIAPGVEVVDWNSDRLKVVTQPTTPMPIITKPILAIRTMIGHDVEMHPEWAEVEDVWLR